MPNSVCRLLIVDDHPMLTQSLALLLAKQVEFAVVAQFHSAAALLNWLHAASQPLPADVLLLDLHLPGPDGLTLLQQVRQQWPMLHVLVFSMSAAADTIKRVAEAGARGFVPKSADASELLDAIRAVHAGHTSFAAASAPDRLVASNGHEPQLLQRLTAREREIVGLIRQGHTTRDIAQQLFLSEFTVGTHRRNIMHKLQLTNVAALVQFAVDNGL
jgi:DNA-binding NarL/FixJ family response regulator